MDTLDHSTKPAQNTPKSTRKFKSCSVCETVQPVTEFLPKRRICRDCRHKQQQAYYRKNRKQRLAYSKLYRAEHKEQIQAKQKQYRTENRESKNAYSRRYYRANRGRQIQYSREYYQVHCEHEIAAASVRHNRRKAKRFAQILAGKGGQS